MVGCSLYLTSEGEGVVQQSKPVHESVWADLVVFYQAVAIAQYTPDKALIRENAKALAYRCEVLTEIPVPEHAKPMMVKRLRVFRANIRPRPGVDEITALRATIAATIKALSPPKRKRR